MQEGWVKNYSRVPQSWGSYTAAPGAIIPVSAVIVANERRSGTPGVAVLDPADETWIFKRTPHAPANRRYGSR